MCFIYCWKEILGQAVLLRVFAETEELIVPETLGGMPVVGIGAYCFSAASHMPEEVCVTGWQGDGAQKVSWGELREHVSRREFAGDMVQEVCLPDTVVKLERNAFYDCRRLQKIVAGQLLRDIGSDVFMNCRLFRELCVRSDSGCRSGAGQLLSRYASNLTVVFASDRDEREIYAKIFYPEYTEGYDEIAPAHIFGKNIIGEGFRARQCFLADAPDFAGYDSVFSKAKKEEDGVTAGWMAVCRLRFPLGLREEYREEYSRFLRESGGDIFCALVRERSLDDLEYLCREKLAGAEVLDKGIALASGELDWSEGAAFLLRQKQLYYRGVRRRYEF